VPETGRIGVGVTVWRRAAAGVLAGEDHLLDEAHWAEDLPGVVAGAPGDRVANLGPAPAELLICGHGKRDRCCGNFGVRLAVAVDGRWEGVRIRRASHLGGHRYAPTALTLPDGRLWAFLDPDVLDRVVAGTVDAVDLSLHHRGSTAYDPWQQAVESALWARLGAGWLEVDVREATTERRHDGTAEVRMCWTGPSGDGEARAIVEVVRELPVPICGSPIEDAVKSSREYGVRELQVR
jgi:hypothetical protein